MPTNLVRQIAVQIAAELQGVVDRFLAMIEAELDRPLDNVRHFLADGLAQVFADAVAAEGEGKAGLLVPPDAEVDDQMQAEVLKCQLAFVNDQSGVGFAVFDELRGFGRNGRGWP